MTGDRAMTLSDHFRNERRMQVTRRWFFQECGVGLGAIALDSLLGGTWRGRPRPPTHGRPARAEAAALRRRRPSA